MIFLKVMSFVVLGLVVLALIGAIILFVGIAKYQEFKIMREKEADAKTGFGSYIGYMIGKLWKKFNGFGSYIGHVIGGLWNFFKQRGKTTKERTGKVAFRASSSPLDTEDGNQHKKNPTPSKTPKNATVVDSPADEPEPKAQEKSEPEAQKKSELRAQEGNSKDNPLDVISGELSGMAAHLKEATASAKKEVNYAKDLINYLIKYGPSMTEVISGFATEHNEANRLFLLAMRDTSINIEGGKFLFEEIKGLHVAYNQMKDDCSQMRVDRISRISKMLKGAEVQQGTPKNGAKHPVAQQQLVCTTN